jgi:hypothetical protein
MHEDKDVYEYSRYKRYSSYDNKIKELYVGYAGKLPTQLFFDVPNDPIGRMYAFENGYKWWEYDEKLMCIRIYPFLK